MDRFGYVTSCTTSGAAVLVAASVLMAVAAGAEGLTQSLPLSEVLARTRASPQVALLVRLQLKRAKLKRDDIVCTGHVLDRTWLQLGGSIVGPYRCPIGSRTLDLMAKPIYTDAGGIKVKRLDPALKERAVAARETRFAWRWTKD